MTNLPVLPAGAPPEQLSFGQMLKRAEIFSKTQLVAPDLQGKPEAIVLVGARGAELGVPFALALQEIYVIKNRTFVSTQLRLALIRRAGHEVRFAESSSERAVIKGRRKEYAHDPDGWVTATWTIADAERANLLGKEVWKSYPADMLRARAAGALSRMEFSDVLLGMDLDLETAEEAGFDPSQDLDEPADTTAGEVVAPAANDDGAQGEVIEDAVIEEDLGSAPEDPDPPVSTETEREPPPPAPEPAASGTIAGPAAVPPMPTPTAGDRDDIAALKTRIVDGITPIGWANLVPWLEACGINPNLSNRLSAAKVGALHHELDQRGIAKIPTADAVPPPPPIPRTDG